MSRRRGSRDAAKRSNSPGCLLYLVVYFAMLVPAYYFTLPPTETESFDGRTARMFSVATFPVNEDAPQDDPRRTTLESINTGNYDGQFETFLLPQPRVAYRDGDPHRVSVIENGTDWQLVRFQYSNTYTATSLYRAYGDRIEPVSFSMTSHVGQGSVALVMLFVAWLVAKIIAMVRAAKQARDEHADSTSD